MPEAEWDQSMRAPREPLPATLRITGCKRSTRQRCGCEGLEALEEGARASQRRTGRRTWQVGNHAKELLHCLKNKLFQGTGGPGGGWAES